jgi:hypothetical protein
MNREFHLPKNADITHLRDIVARDAGQVQQQFTI